MQIDVSALTAERAGLLARVKEIDQALETARAGGAVQIRIFGGRAYRRYRGYSTDLGDVEGKVVVYEDENLATVTSRSNSSGWITAADWAYIQANRSEELFGEVSEVK